MVDDTKNARDMDSAELWRAARDFDRADYALQESQYRIPDYLAGRDAASFSPREDDDFRKALGIDRKSMFAIDKDQQRWEGDPDAVAAREADIERMRIERAASESGEGP